MKVRIIFLVLFIYSLLYSVTYEIKQDGTGDFTVIQDGIDFCSARDIILVYPGTYYENLVIQEKAFTLCSLFHTTGDESYIEQTILDGNNSDSVIRIEDTNAYYNWLTIVGFVIQHGIGYQYNAPYQTERAGGGLYISESSLAIRNCIIQFNHCTVAGGGIALSNSILNLSGSTIRFNQSDDTSGGILIGSTSSDVNFDSENLNNIYMNYSGRGNDIFITPGSPFQEIIVDTFTVIDPLEGEGYYYVFPGSGGAGIPMPDKFSVDIQHGYIGQVEADLYVSADGDNTNSGLSETEPLQSISHALIKIRSDSLVQRTIHLADGLYSASLNNQKFPVHIKSYVDITGESAENTVLDRESTGGLFLGNDGQNSYQISNMSLINAYDWPCYMATQNTDVMLTNIYNTNHTNQYHNYKSYYLTFCDAILNKIVCENNIYGSIYFYSPKYGTKFIISNSIIRNNQPVNNNTGCLQIGCGRSILNSDSLIVNIINTL